MLNQQKLLEQLFIRLAYTKTQKLHIPFSELGEIPVDFIQFLTQESLLKKLNDSKAICCHECEQACVEDVHYHPTSEQFYIHCIDAGRLPIHPHQLQVWELTFTSLAKKIALLCGCQGQEKEKEHNHWHLGFYYGENNSLVSLELSISPEKGICLMINGHAVPLSQLFIIEHNKLLINQQLLSSLAKMYFSSHTDTSNHSKRDKQRFTTQQKIDFWQKRYLEEKKANTQKKDSQIAKLITKESNERFDTSDSEDYVRRYMKPAKNKK